MMKYEFTSGAIGIYTEEKGSGFVDPNTVKGKTASVQALSYGGWNMKKSRSAFWKNTFFAAEDRIELKEERDLLVFRANVREEGCYRITAAVKAGPEGIRNLSVFTNRRNVLARRVSLLPGEEKHIIGNVCVTDYIPAMTSVPYTERAVFLSITGEHAALSSVTIEKVDLPVLFIAGDSTLTDQNAPAPYYPVESYAGWAQCLTQYAHGLAVCNQAHSGLTTACFRDDGHWDIVRRNIKPGDFFMIQFGHNDQKRRNLAAFGGYIQNLRRFVKEVRELGAFPLILSPISRIPFEEDGRMCSLLKTHALACKTAAEELQVPFIDLHTHTFRDWCEMKERTPLYFAPGDSTHTNDYGAERIASYVVTEIERQRPGLQGFLKAEGEARLSPEQDTARSLPEAAQGSPFEIEIPYVDISGIPQYNDMALALRKGLLDPCVMHLHPKEMMPRAQFLMPFFKALRISGKRPYRQRFMDIGALEWDTSYVQGCLEENLIDPKTVDEHFRPDEALTVGEFSSFLIRALEKEKSKREIPLPVCFELAGKLGLLPCGCRAEEMICRADCYSGLVKLMEKLKTGDLDLPADTELHPVG